jgi:hypothetical protein
MVEPAFGIGGALTALQENRPAMASGAESGDLRGAASELSRAARGLESVRGNISSQTSSINQLAMSQQQQMRQLQGSVTQLNASIGQLASNLGRMSSNMMMMGAAPMQAPGGAPPVPGMPMGPPRAENLNMQRFGALASSAYNMAGRAMVGAGGMVAGAAGSMMSPFMGGGFSPAQQGQYAGQIRNAAGLRSSMMGMGWFNNNLMRSAGGGQISQLASDRAAMRMGDIGLSMGAGALEMGGAGLGALGGGALGAAAGGALAGPVGGFVGGIAGSMLGGTVGGAAIAAGSRPMLRQLGQIRGGGELAGRQAFRFLDPSMTQGAANMPSFKGRQRMGSMMMNEGIGDLTLSEQDMQGMFGSMVEQDLMRGANNMKKVRRTFQMNKDAIKEMARTMGQTMEIAAGTLGDMQAMGISTENAQKVLAGAGVRGLTRQEALAGQQQFVGQFQGTGLQGIGLQGVAAASQGLGQTAIGRGALDAEQLAAIGGRGGAQQVMGKGMVNFLQSSMGQAALMAGMKDGQFDMGRITDKGVIPMMQQAGANATPGNLMALKANPEKYMREAMKDPDGLAAVMFTNVKSAAEKLRPPGVSLEDTMVHVLKQQGMNSQDADSFMQMMKVFPESAKERSRERLRVANDQMESQAMENTFSIVEKPKRWAKRGLSVLSKPMAAAFGRSQDAYSAAVAGVKDWATGTATTTVKAGDVNAKNLRSLLGGGKGMSDSRRRVRKSQPSEEQKMSAKAKVRMALASKGGAEGYTALSKLRDETDPEKRKMLAEKIMKDLGGDSYDESNPEMMKAIEDAVNSTTGQNISGSLVERASTSVIDAEKIREVTDDIDVMLSGSSVWGELGDEKTSQIARSDEFQELVKLQKKAKSAGGLNKEEQMKMDTIIANTSLDMDVINEIKDMSASDIGKLSGRMEELSELSGSEGMRAALKGTGGAIAKALKGTGKGGAFASAGGDAATMIQALQDLKLTDKEKKGLKGPEGAQLRRAMGLADIETEEDFVAAVGGREAADKFLQGREFTPERAAEYAALDMAKNYSVEGAMKTGGRGFTNAQQQQQSEMIQTVGKNAKALGDLTAAIKDLNSNLKGGKIE